jgi:methionyl-tRNA formyltransferase
MPSSSTLVFCGTPAFAVPTLEKLVEAGFAVRLVVTQPDRPKGRHMELVPSAVKQRALQLNLPVSQPDKIRNNDEFRTHLTAIKPDAIIVVGYGRIIPSWMIDLPRLGNLNLHGSLLPKYRGAAPIQWAIARGESVTGVTTMRIDAGLDTGDILLQKEIPIAFHDTSETLSPRLAAIGADLMVETLRGLQTGSIQARPQDDAQATLAPILKKEDGHRFSSHRPGNPEPHARLPTLAGGLHQFSRQESAHLGSAASGSQVGRRSTRSRRQRAPGWLWRWNRASTARIANRGQETNAGV